MLGHRIRRIEALVNRLGLDEAERKKLPARRLQTVQDVIDLLEEQVEAIRAAPWAGALAKARAIGHLARVAGMAIADGKMAARIEILETVLKSRKNK